MFGWKMLALFGALCPAVVLVRADDHPPKPGTPGKSPATPERGLVIAITGDKVAVNGKSFTLPVERKALVSLLGKPDREAKLANAVLTWDELGLFAVVTPETTKVSAVSVALGRDTPTFWPKKSFAGVLTVDGAGVTADATVAEINKAKKGAPFEKDSADADGVVAEGKTATIYLRKGTAGGLVELSIDAKDG